MTKINKGARREGEGYNVHLNTLISIAPSLNKYIASGSNLHYIILFFKLDSIMIISHVSNKFHIALKWHNIQNAKKLQLTKFNICVYFY